MKNFKTEELLSFSEVVAEITEVLADMYPEDLAELYNRLTNDYTEVKYDEDSLFNKIIYAPIDPNESNLTVGVFYELPDGRITKTYGGNSVKREVSHYFDKENSNTISSFEEVKLWKKRKDLKDFPNARDPKLPYEFDLNWDIKYESELKKMLDEHSFGWLNREGVVEVLKGYPELAKKLLDLDV